MGLSLTMRVTIANYYINKFLKIEESITQLLSLNKYQISKPSNKLFPLFPFLLKSTPYLQQCWALHKPVASEEQ